MYRADIEEERWTRIQESEVWLRLAKISQAGAQLGAAARGRLEEISARHPGWRLAENERDEFPTWTGDPGELRVHVATPRDRNGLIQWLRDNPEPDDWRPDDWNERCRDDFDEAASALAALAAEGTWPGGRWREALQRWSEDELRERSWGVMAPVLVDVPGETLQELCHGVSWWLEKQARTLEGQEATFLSLCDRVMALDYEAEEEDDDIVGRAINHPVGHVTEGLLHWWYRSDLEDQGGLADEPRRVFTQLCDTGVPKFPAWPRVAGNPRDFVVPGGPGMDDPVPASALRVGQLRGGSPRGMGRVPLVAEALCALDGACSSRPSWRRQTTTPGLAGTANSTRPC